MSTTPYVPTRTCAATGQKLPQSALLRFINVGGIPTPEVMLGRHRAPGRGVYIQPTAQALAAAIKRKVFPHRIKTNQPPLSWNEIEPYLPTPHLVG